MPCAPPTLTPAEVVPRKPRRPAPSSPEGMAKKVTGNRRSPQGVPERLTAQRPRAGSGRRTSSPQRRTRAAPLAPEWAAPATRRGPPIGPSGCAA